MNLEKNWLLMKRIRNLTKKGVKILVEVMMQVNTMASIDLLNEV